MAHQGPLDPVTGREIPNEASDTADTTLVYDPEAPVSTSGAERVITLTGGPTGGPDGSHASGGRAPEIVADGTLRRVQPIEVMDEDARIMSQ